MKKVRFAIIGGGWRSAFYLRVARALPEAFEVTGLWTRNPEKRSACAKAFSVRDCADIEELVSTNPDFVVVSLSWDPAFEYNMKMLEMGVPVLTETPVAPDLKALNRLWEEVQARNAKFLCGEAYQFQPYYCAAEKLAESGVIGERQSLTLSMMHGYHACNIARRLLGTKICHAEIHGKQLKTRFVKTCDRNGPITDGTETESVRDLVTVDFADGKSLLYDFCDEQYFSMIRSRYLQLCGSSGEIFYDTVRSFQNGCCTVEKLQRADFYGEGNLSSIAHRGYTFRGQWVYENPFPGAILTDDEISVAARLAEMEQYLETGEPGYTLQDACQDAYLSLLMKEAATEGKTVSTEPQAWLP